MEVTLKLSRHIMGSDGNLYNYGVFLTYNAINAKIEVINESIDDILLERRMRFVFPRKYMYVMLHAQLMHEFAPEFVENNPISRTEAYLEAEYIHNRRIPTVWIANFGKQYLIEDCTAKDFLEDEWYISKISALRALQNPLEAQRALGNFRRWRIES